MLDERREINFTEGNLFVKIFKFIVPLMLTTVFQLLYTSVDLWTVSQYGGGTLSMTAIGSNGALISLIIMVLVSLAMGSNVCISVAKGQGNKEKSERILHTGFMIAIVGGIIFALIGYLVSPSILSLMKTPESLYDNAVLYIRIYFIGLPVMMIYNFGSQMLRALGDSKRPFYILLISGIINVLLDLLLVITFKMDVAGVGIATVASQVISALLIILYFRYSKKVYVNLGIKKLKFYKDELKDILKIGIPSGLQGLCFCIPNVIIQSSLYSIVNHYINGVYISVNEIVGGASAAGQVENYIFAILNSVATGLVSITGQNYGSNNIKRIKKGYWYSLIWLMILWAVSCSIVAIFTDSLLKIFIVESEDMNAINALAAGKERIYLMIFTYWLDGLVDINGAYLKGIKKSVPPAIICLLGIAGFRVLFLLTLFKLDYFHTIFWLYAAFPISWIIVNIVYIPVILIVEKKRFKEIELSFNK